ncbi:hypothetical protein [Rodentibacter genomosp. 1]|uniref:hypothetical protein n=1 Tax=Rodentibacter genomosp. 1 TaxID=1908264 RepID=UPI00098644D3|nr:hypothetical protein [Rodentibacter genomosp. 1]
MENLVINKEFEWNKELEKTVINSLATTFGLDFLLFEDKKGGNVDTIYNVRKGTWATEEEKQKYDNREDYNPEIYHKHENYIKNNKEMSNNKKNGEVVDAYIGENVPVNAKIDQDHIVSANEIHNDPGRILAELKGEDLANRDENLVPVSSSLNRSKQDMS